MGTIQSFETTTIHPEVVSNLLAGAQRSDIDLENILKRCDINAEVLRSHSARIPVENAAKVMRICGGLMKDEFAGLMNSPLPIGYLRMGLLSTLHQSSLGKALTRFFEFNELIIKGLKFSLTEKEDQAEITFDLTSGVSFVNDIALDYLIMCTYRMANWLCNESIVINEIELNHAPPSCQEEYRSIFSGANVKFNSTRNRLTFDKHYLDLPIVRNEDAVSAYNQNAPLGLFLPKDVRGSTRQTVRKIIKQRFAKQDYITDLQEVAQIMKLGEQTIRRRLAREGTSFNCIKTQVKQDIAMISLGNPHLSIEEIALRTGYSKPAAFIRAFKTWTGFSPAKFRKRIN